MKYSQLQNYLSTCQTQAHQNQEQAIELTDRFCRSLNRHMKDLEPGSEDVDPCVFMGNNRSINYNSDCNRWESTIEVRISIPNSAFIITFPLSSNLSDSELDFNIKLSNNDINLRCSKHDKAKQREFFDKIENIIDTTITRVSWINCMPLTSAKVIKL